MSYVNPHCNGEPFRSSSTRAHLVQTDSHTHLDILLLLKDCNNQAKGEKSLKHQYYILDLIQYTCLLDPFGLESRKLMEHGLNKTYTGIISFFSTKFVCKFQFRMDFKTYLECKCFKQNRIRSSDKGLILQIYLKYFFISSRYSLNFLWLVTPHPFILCP